MTLAQSLMDRALEAESLPLDLEQQFELQMLISDLSVYVESGREVDAQMEASAERALAFIGG